MENYAISVLEKDLFLCKKAKESFSERVKMNYSDAYKRLTCQISQLETSIDFLKQIKINK